MVMPNGRRNSDPVPVPKCQRNGVESFIASNLIRTPTPRCALAPMLAVRMAAKTFSV